MINIALKSLFIFISYFCFYFVSEEVGQFESLWSTWLFSFGIPLWSIVSIGAWYDAGKILFGEVLSIDSKNSKKPISLRASVFTLWMSLILTFIVWTHVSFQSTFMLIMVPILMPLLSDILLSDWSSFKLPSVKESFTVLCWSLISFQVYWIMYILWIFFRVWLLDVTGMGYVIYIR